MEYILAVYEETKFFLDFQHTISIEDTAEFLSAIDIAIIEEGREYEISALHIQYINTRFNLNIANDQVINIRHKMAYDNLPYQLHNNKELELMLAGKKPLSVFESLDPTCEQKIFPEVVFDQYVAALQLFKKVQFIAPGQRIVLYATDGNQWRMDAYVFLMDAARGEKWTASFELLQGLLLGYSKAETEIYIQYLISRGIIL